MPDTGQSKRQNQQDERSKPGPDRFEYGKRPERRRKRVGKEPEYICRNRTLGVRKQLLKGIVVRLAPVSAAAIAKQWKQHREYGIGSVKPVPPVPLEAGKKGKDAVQCAPFQKAGLAENRHACRKGKQQAEILSAHEKTGRQSSDDDETGLLPFQSLACGHDGDDHEQSEPDFDLARAGAIKNGRRGCKNSHNAERPGRRQITPACDIDQQACGKTRHHGPEIERRLAAKGIGYDIGHLNKKRHGAIESTRHEIYPARFPEPPDQVDMISD